MAKKLTTRQIKQLCEINDSGVGIGDEVQELIRRLTDGGIADKKATRKSIQPVDIRAVQAKRYWDKGFGRELGFKKFKDYLASIPEVPERFKADDPDMPLLVLVEPRLNSIVKTCQLIGVAFGGNDQTFVPFNKRHVTPNVPRWVRMHDGRKNHNRQPSTCRTELKDGEFSGTDLVGVCAYLHYPDCVREGEHIMDLPGSVGADYRDRCACLGVWGGRVELYWCHSGNARPDCGSASCRE